MEKLPPNRLADIDARSALLSSILQAVQGAKVDIPLIDCLAARLFTVLEVDNLEIKHIKNTLFQYDGTLLTPELCALLSRQFAARCWELPYGPLNIYVRPVRPEWIPVEIVAMTPVLWRDAYPGQELKLYCMSGHPAGHTLSKRVSDSWLRKLAYTVGYNRRLQFEGESADLVGLRFWGRAVANEDGEFDFDEMNIDAKLKKYNRITILRRTRFDRDTYPDTDEATPPGECPFNFDHPCQGCPKDTLDCQASYIRNQTCQPAMKT